MNARCDNINDCSDKSDEADCSRVAIEDNYQKFIVPPPKQDKNSVEVKVSIDVSQLMDIRYFEQTILINSKFLLILLLIQ